jgi:Tol biopolymer transport system component
MPHRAVRWKHVRVTGTAVTVTYVLHIIDTSMSTDQVSPGAVEAQLRRMLDSETFRGAERSRALLRFVVEEALHGRSDRLKEYTLGSQALGRGEGFDPRSDPIARVEASRLRSRLDVYYATEGASDPVRISLPRGGYAPVFEWRPISSTTPVVQPSGSAGATAAPSPAISSGWTARTLVGAAVGLALIAVGAWLVGRPSDEPATEVRLEMVTPLTTDPVSLAVSPDGRSVVFVANTEGRARLWIRGLDSANARDLAGTEYASLPFWAPDGQSIGFFVEGKVKRIELETGLVRVISTALVPAGATWNADGVILHPVVPDGPLFRTSAEGGPLTPITQLTAGQTGHRGPTFLPDGRQFLFYAMGSPDVRGIYLGELGTGVVRRLMEADTPAVFVAPNYCLYVQHSTLFAQRIDLSTMTLSGRPISLAEGIGADAMGGVGAFAASAGTIVYRTGQSAGKRQFRWLDRAGKELSRVGSPEVAGPSYASLAPDGHHIAVQRSVDGNTDIWLVDVDRGTPIRFTTDPQADIAPVWSPRGDRIVYASQKDGAFQLMEKAIDGTPARLLLSTPQSKQATDWSRDGRYLLFRTITPPNAEIDIWALPLEGDQKPSPVVRASFEERDAQFSPDGKWIAYHSNESGQHEVYVQPFQGAGERMRITKDGGVQARWRSDGGELFYLTLRGELVAVPIALRPDGRSPQPGPAVPLFQARVGAVQGVALHSYVVAPDGQRFLVETVIEETPPPISIILNWRVPGG